MPEQLDDPLLLRLDRLAAEIAALRLELRRPPPEWLTIEHAAAACDCSYDHVRRAVERGDLAASDIGGGGCKAMHRISRTDLAAWLERHKAGGRVPPRDELREKIARYLPGVG